MFVIVSSLPIVGQEHVGTEHPEENSVFPVAYHSVSPRQDVLAMGWCEITVHFSSFLLLCTCCKGNMLFILSLKCCLLIFQENHSIKHLVRTAVISAVFNTLLLKSAPMSPVCLHVYGSVNRHCSKLSVDLLQDFT